MTPRGRDGALELLEEAVEPTEGVVFDGGRALAQRLEIGQLGDNRGLRFSRMVAVARRRFPRSCESLRKCGAALGKAGESRKSALTVLLRSALACGSCEPGSRRGASSLPRSRNVTAPPPMWAGRSCRGRRAPLRRSRARGQLVAEDRNRGVGVLQGESAAEAATRVGSASSTSWSPSTWRSSCKGCSYTWSTRSEWQVGWYATR